MVKHIVFWRMKPFADGRDAETNMRLAVEELDAVAAQFPALKSITHNKNMFSGGHYWDYVEEMVFDSVDSLRQWAQFPPHQALHAFVEEIREERAAVDYEF